jgi:hypothetical protein
MYLHICMILHYTLSIFMPIHILYIRTHMLINELLLHQFIIIISTLLNVFRI